MEQILMINSKEKYKCSMCSYHFSNLKRYNMHQYFHRKTSKGRFKCRFPNCFYEFQKFINFKMHIFRKHKIVENTFKIKNSIQCNVCNETISFNNY